VPPAVPACGQFLGMRVILLVLAGVVANYAADYTAPAGTRPATWISDTEAILPGGRFVRPLGQQYTTGPGPFGIAISPSGNLVISANGGPDRYSLTVLEKQKDAWRARQLMAPPKPKRAPGDPPEEDDWHSVFMGLAFHGDRELFVSEGDTGRIRVIDPRSGAKKYTLNLNQGGFEDSYTGDLALDSRRGVLYVVDQANFRLVAIEIRRRRVVGSLRLGRLPFAIALSADGRKAYVTNIGMFEYQAVPGADPKQAAETGLPFPAFGFPSIEARGGVRRETARGPVDVPGLGDPNVQESNSLAVVDLANPSTPRLEALVRTGLPFGGGSAGGSSPSGVAVGGGYVFVSNGHNDSITVVDARTNQIRTTIPIRIPGLETLRGVLPVGLTYDPASKLLLVAEAGINAIGVIDTTTPGTTAPAPAQMRLLGHLPAGWFPTRAAVRDGVVYAVNAKGHGTGPNHERAANESSQATIRRGSLSIFPLPKAEEVASLTARVMENNGFVPAPAAPTGATLPAGIRHVVLIVKENRTYDEVFGDIAQASNGPVNGLAALARFGRAATVAPDRRTPGARSVGGLAAGLPTLRNVDITPNHHELAARFAFSDNFYADSEVSVDGHHWLVGSYPNAWTESSLMASYGGAKEFRFPTKAPGRLLYAGSNSSVHPEEQLEAGTIWHHLERNRISFRNYGEGFELAGVEEGPGEKPTGARYVTNVPMPDPLYRNTSRDYPQFNMNIPDQYRATQFIAEVERKYRTGVEPFPQFVFIHLPQDHLTRPRPADGYPYSASYVADNDYALGRIVEYLSHTPWWREMAIFITEDDAQGGVDHVDSHRTMLMAVSPYARKNYVSHGNSSFPGLLKTLFRMLGLPSLNLFDAAASDLSDCFGGDPDFRPYEVLPVDRALFDPTKVKDPLDPAPDSPRMDDPRVVRR
ncbi:MAG TPA: alkaline phosphatase family protein, partial [Bryobacteraceae bacterium]|nr:alkaline phosphatase family protein [Bryobacteraceae bacterium]